MVEWLVAMGNYTQSVILQYVRTEMTDDPIMYQQMNNWCAMYHGVKVAHSGQVTQYRQVTVDKSPMKYARTMCNGKKAQHGSTNKQL